MCWFCLWIIFVLGIFGYLSSENGDIWRLDMVQIYLWILPIFLVWFFLPKLSLYPQSIYYHNNFWCLAFVSKSYIDLLLYPGNLLVWLCYVPSLLHASSLKPTKRFWLFKVYIFTFAVPSCLTFCILSKYVKKAIFCVHINLHNPR